MEHAVSRKLAVPMRNMEWSSSYAKLARLNRGVFGLIEELSKSYDIVLLSNNSIGRYTEAKKAFLDNLHFEKAYISAYLHMRKPDARAYRHVLMDRKAKAGEAVFIDNQPDNVRGAMKVGIDSIRFESYGQLVKALKKRGLL
jgi:putative hydrolase of the HAD superfamily